LKNAIEKVKKSDFYKSKGDFYKSLAMGSDS
jgi:hypothetical protein